MISVLVAFSGCTAIRVVTAKDRKHQVESPESVQRFVKQKRISGYPVLSAYPLHLNLPGSWYSVFNAHGQYINTSQDAVGCKDRAYDYRILRYLMEHGDERYITDSVTQISYAIKESALRSGLNLKWTNVEQARQDTSIWVKHIHTFDAHLDNVLPNIRSLEGKPVHIDVACGEYLIFRKLYLSGKSSLDAVLIRELIHDVEQLNREFDNRLHLYLIYRNQLDWMEH
jgi:hypothetical protein